MDLCALRSSSIPSALDFDRPVASGRRWPGVTSRRTSSFLGSYPKWRLFVLTVLSLINVAVLRPGPVHVVCAVQPVCLIPVASNPRALPYSLTLPYLALPFFLHARSLAHASILFLLSSFRSFILLVSTAIFLSSLTSRPHFTPIRPLIS